MSNINKIDSVLLNIITLLLINPRLFTVNKYKWLPHSIF